MTRTLGIAALAAIIALSTIIFSEMAFQALTGEPTVTSLTYDAFMRQW
jgi:hypothetical protein